MAGPTEVRYDSAGVTLVAYSWGSGRPLILLHSSGLATHAMFAGLACELEEVCRVLACDVRGFGKSVSRDPAAHTWASYADDVVALMDQLGVSNAVIGGYSFGSGIALATALRHAGRVDGLVLAGPGYAGGEVGQTEPQKAVWADGRALFARVRAHGLQQTLLAGIDAETERRSLLQRAAEHDEVSFLAAHEGELATSQPFPDLAALESITVPTLLLADDAHDPQIAHWYAERLPSVTVAKVAASDSSRWAESIRKFLDDPPVPAADGLDTP